MRAPRLLQDLAVARGDGSYGRMLSRLAKFDLLAIDDWLLNPLKDSERTDLTSDQKAKAEQTKFATEDVIPRFRSNPLFKKV